jgi:Fe-S-cluster containining protein
MSSPCAECTRGCCKRYTVTVTGYDVWRIASSLRLAPEQFLAVVRQREPNQRGFKLDASDTRYDIALDKAPARGTHKPCVFWLPLGDGRGRCGIYAQRPYVCQTYPAILGPDMLALRREDVLCADTDWRDGTLEAPIWRERLFHMAVEFDMYAYFVAHWNAMLNSSSAEAVHPSLYFAYLIERYRRLEAIRSAYGDPQWQALCQEWAAQYLRGASPLTTSNEPSPALAPIIAGICAAASN